MILQSLFWFEWMGKYFVIDVNSPIHKGVVKSIAGKYILLENMNNLKLLLYL